MNNLQDLLTLIQFFKDTSKVEAKLKEFQDENDRLEANIVASGVVGDVSVALAAAKRDQDAAKAQLAKTEEEALRILATSKVAYDARNAAIKKRENDADQKLADAQAALKAAEGVLADNEQRVERMKRDLADKQAKLEQDQLEVNARLAKLKSVME